MTINVAGVLYGPCHGIVQTALANKKWLYTRDLASHTSLPTHILETALAQMISAHLVEYDAYLQRFKLKHISNHTIRNRLGSLLDQKHGAHEFSQSV